MPRLSCRRPEPEGRLLRGDMRIVLPTLPEASVDLAYLDPPFGTGRDFGAYDDRSGALSSMTADRDPRIETVLSLCPDAAGRSWLAGLAECLAAVRRVLKPSGSAWVHLDERRAHLARLVCEIVLAPAIWKRTVIWRYRRWPTPQRSFQAMHDVLFWFAGEGHAWNQLHEPLSPTTLEIHGTRRQKHTWIRGQDKSRQLAHADEESPGAYLSDVWEISLPAPNSLERRDVGKYPTQKPLLLLGQIIESTSNPGDIVLDPCAGSGTTLAAASSLGRRWIGIDKGDEAIRTIEKRLGVEAES